jgi:serine/threonine protein kinase
VSITFESFGKYVLLEKLATGGMAEVFLARGTGTAGIGKFFAVKRILPQYADSPEFIEMFKDEAKIAINLNHSNIVSIHEFGVEKGQFYLVMDYVEGRNLRQILNKMKKSSLQFSIDQIVYCIKEVGAGLDHAHRCIDGSTGKPLNITHRDMSPQNLMVSFEGEVKIVDFGIAKAESQIETTRAGTLKGKFGYMSPEQAEGLPVDLRTDIFSLGIVLWELLANDRLFVANNEINTLRKIRDCQIPSLRKINPNIHTELERIVQKALARDRNLRYQTGAALHRDLNRFLNRQYPDFSPQDFSVFIKSVFADEILSLRKRLVEYSKVNLGSTQAPVNPDFDDHTSLLNTNTNSLVISGNSSVTTGSAARDANSRDIDSKTNSSLITEPQSSASIEVDAGTRTAANDLPPPPRAPSQNTKVLDEKALAAEMTREISVKAKVPSHLDTEEVSSPSIRQQTRSYTNRPVTRPSRGKPTPKPARFATMMVFALLCLGVYAYLVKYFTPMMADVITMTDPLIHPFHTALGVDPHATNVSSEGRANARPVVPQNQMPPPGQPVAVAVPKPADPNLASKPATPEEEPTSHLVVNTNPSGAEILINEKNTGLLTPCQVEIPNGKFSITIHKNGYQDYKYRDVNKESLGRRLIVNLTKQNVAYVDIDVFPPQDAVIFINGKRITDQHTPIRQLPVSANTPLKIRAENRSGTSYDEQVINLPVDRRQSIQLNPRKPMRLPSNSPNE